MTIYNVDISRLVKDDHHQMTNYAQEIVCYLESLPYCSCNCRFRTIKKILSLLDGLIKKKQYREVVLCCIKMLSLDFPEIDKELLIEKIVLVKGIALVNHDVDLFFICSNTLYLKAV